MHRSSMPRAANCDEESRARSRSRILIDVLIVMFGISAWIGVNGIYVQLPLLVQAAPEGWSLPAYIVIVVQIANVGPMVYAIFRRFAPNLCSESAWISSLLVIGTAAIGILAFCYDARTDVNGAEHSVAMLTLAFAVSLVGCSSSVLFVPYLRNFHEVHLVSFFIGEGLSGLLSSGIALVQGVGGSPVCPGNGTSSSADSQPAPIAGPNFSPKLYFLMLFAVLVSSTCAFWLLDYLLAVRNQRISSVEEVATRSDPLRDHPVPSRRTLSEKTPSFDGTVDPGTTPSRTCDKSSRWYLYVLMGVICLAGNGFLPGIQSYSCLPYGNVAYHLTVNLAQLANPLACVLALWLPSPGLRGITVVSVLAAIGTSHVSWLAFSSPTPPWRDTTLGVVLVVVAWVLLIGLVTYAKLSITAIFRREPGAKALFYVGVVTQTGSAAGAVCSFVLINYSNLLVPYTACASHP